MEGGDCVNKSDAAAVAGCKLPWPWIVLGGGGGGEAGLSDMGYRS